MIFQIKGENMKDQFIMTNNLSPTPIFKFLQQNELRAVQLDDNIIAFEFVIDEKRQKISHT